MSKQWAKGSTAAWRRVRAQVLARDGRRCRIQIVGVCTTVADQVHHTIGRAVTRDNPAHLIAACRACNLRVGDPTGHDPDPTPRRWWDDEPIQ
jgi:5-methylcytosine-specific restriction endonuclease McrA